MVHWVGEAGAGSTGVANEAAVGESDDGGSGGVNGALREGGEAAQLPPSQLVHLELHP